MGHTLYISVPDGLLRALDRGYTVPARRALRGEDPDQIHILSVSVETML